MTASFAERARHGATRWCLPALAAWALLLTLGISTTADAAEGDTLLVSVSSDLDGAESDSFGASISADGRYVAFDSFAIDIPGDLNGAIRDVFVRDAVTGETTLVSADAAGGPADGQSDAPSISADGRYVAFASTATNIPSDLNGAVRDIFVRDMTTGETVLASVDAAGGAADDNSSTPSISADGEHVAFVSNAGDIDGDVNGGGGINTDIFVRDLVTAQTTLVSASTDNDGANNQSFEPSISGDGRYVAFRSAATDIEGNLNGSGLNDIFVRDLVTNTTRLASIDVDADGANNVVNEPSISANGRYVAFETLASDIEGDLSPGQDVFVHDLVTARTVLASVDANGGGANDDSGEPSISASGRYVAFESDATDIEGHTGGGADLFVRDLQTDTTVLASDSIDGNGADGSSRVPALSGDGRHLAFESLATDLDGDLNGNVRDIFRHTVLPDPPRNLEVPALTGEPVSGSTLSCSAGLWTEGSTAWQWRRDGVAIPGALGASYQPDSADVGRLIDCLVTASNADGSSSEASNAVLISQPLQGPTGAQGPQGDPGDDGADGEPAIKLLLLAAAEKVSARAGKKLSLRVATSGTGKLRALLKAQSKQTRKRFKPVKKTKTVKQAGTTKLTLKLLANKKGNKGKRPMAAKRQKRKAKKRPVPAGSYKLKLRLIGSDGQKATDTVKVKVRR